MTTSFSRPHEPGDLARHLHRTGDGHARPRAGFLPGAGERVQPRRDRRAPVVVESRRIAGWAARPAGRTPSSPPR
ncbi:MAG: hypothetical protein WKF58_11990 [Ilumatobacteraceae bacterium]